MIRRESSPGELGGQAAQAEAVPRAATLGNERYSAYVTALGTGLSTFGKHAINRWTGDRISDCEGFLVYLKDADTGALWSVGANPIPTKDGRSSVSWAPGTCTLERDELEIHAALDVAVAADEALEIRRLRLRNRSSRARTIEIASSIDVVLHHRAADLSHPAFSRLFVQTAWDAPHGALIASRRPRDAGERFPVAIHALLEEKAPDYESDRARFLGRGGGRVAPASLVTDGAWSRTVGNVLDPVFALRATVTIAPGESIERTFVLAAAWTREEALAALERARKRGSAAILDAARADAAVGAPAEPADDARTQLSFHPAPPGGPSLKRRARGTTTAERIDAARATEEPLRFWNGYGGFTEDGRAYVIRLPRAADGWPQKPPQPWVNVLANESFGCLVSETGAGTTWSQNSRERRLTPWSNDALLDPHGEAFYVKDEATGTFVSAWPGPAPGAGDAEVRHEFGVSRCRQADRGLLLESDVFVALHDPVQVRRTTVTNTGTTDRRLAFVAYRQLVLGASAEDTRASIVTALDVASGALLAENPADTTFGARVAFSRIVGPEVRHTCDRLAFLGAGGTVAHPRGLVDATAFDSSAGADFDPCFAERVSFTLAPGESRTIVSLFGDGADRDDARGLVARYSRPGAADAALAEVTRFWRGLVTAVEIETPSPAIDLMVNGWLAYQTLACRMWGRTAFYQSGGAFGFRDQLQDASALVHLDPSLFRAQIVLHAAHQFEEGDVLHWWHPPSGRGLRTRFADDLLWLPWLAATYVRATGDASVLDERAGYRAARTLEPGEQEAYLPTTGVPAKDTVYEHAVRAIDRSLDVGNGAHGLPLFGCGDWNDGMNRVGQGGKGESVWMAFFLCTVIADFVPLCEARGDSTRVTRYRDARTALIAALEKHGWDGAWYRRGYFDDGTPLGSATSTECRIDALAQAWAVLSNAVPRERAMQGMDEVERHLVSEGDGIVRLLTPPFVHSDHDPGYIQGYVAGVRENGGQYTHAALWVVRALAELGRRDRAAHLLELLSPVTHAQSAAQVAHYQVEPYVVAADVYGADPHVGRGGWTWYTGSAGWMLRVALESVLGVRVEGGNTLLVEPCVPDAWPAYRVSRRFPDGTTYELRVTNPSGRAEAVVSATADGSPIASEEGRVRVPLTFDRATHAVEVVLGPRVGGA